MAYEKKKVPQCFCIDGFYTAFAFAWSDTSAYSGESHDFWEMVFIESGSVIVTEDEKVYTLEKNQLVFHAPNEFHRIRCVQGKAPTGYILTFSAVGVLPEDVKNGVFTLSGEEAERLAESCRDLAAFVSGEGKSPQFAFTAVARLTAFVAGLGTEDDSATLSDSATREYRRAVSAMERGICDNVSLPQIAQQCNISVSYLKLLFRKYAGISPKQYYNHLRCRHAAELLTSGMTVAETAVALSLSSPAYFSTFFQKHMGVSPSVYQRQQQREKV